MDVSSMFLRSFRGVSREFQGCLKKFSRVFQECVKAVSRKFQSCVKLIAVKEPCSGTATEFSNFCQAALRLGPLMVEKEMKMVKSVAINVVTIATTTNSNDSAGANSKHIRDTARGSEIHAPRRK